MTQRRNETSKPSLRLTPTADTARGERQSLVGHGRVTIRDVAEHAGVSLGTASNVLNRPDRVAPETLARVLDAIDQLGFVRSSAAHQMRGRSNSRCFGAVVLDASNPFSTETVRGLEDAVHEQGSAVVLCSTDGSPDREARYLRWLEEQRVQGIVITPATRSIRHLETLRDRGTLVVLLDRPCNQGEFCSVSVDHARGGELAAGHLFDLGHRRIAFINGPLHLSQCAERRRGMRRAARSAGLGPDESIIEYTIDPITAFEQAELTVDKLLALPDRPDRRCLRERPDRLQGASGPRRAQGARAARHERGRLRRRRLRGDALTDAHLDPTAQVRARQGRGRATDRRDHRPDAPPRGHPLRARARRAPVDLCPLQAQPLQPARRLSDPGQR